MLLRGDDLPLLVRVSYSRFRRLDCRETGQLISPGPRTAAAAAAWRPAAALSGAVSCVCLCVFVSLSVARQAAAVIGPCCEEKTEFGLEFPRPCAVDETLPWLSEHRLAGWLLCWCLFVSLSPSVCCACLCVGSSVGTFLGTLLSCTSLHLHAKSGFYISWSCGCEVLRGPFPEATSMRLRGELGSPAVSH